jgi:catechol 2,3-dioxygenase-like lactoylglutathione lyase family enzyme
LTHDVHVDDRCSPLVVELDVSDLRTSVDFYVSLGFTVAVDRPERRFAHLTRNGCVDLMLQAADGPGERIRTGALERPFGRGVCLLVACRDVDAAYTALLASRYEPNTVPAARWSQQGLHHIVNRQFVVADPDGYLLRIYTEHAD